jgi:Peptidase inhibitor family I36
MFAFGLGGCVMEDPLDDGASEDWTTAEETGALALESAGARAEDDDALAFSFNGVCEAGEFCLFEHEDFRGDVIDYGTSGGRTCDSSYSNNNFPGTNHDVDDQTSSWFNRTNLTIRIYDDDNYQSGGSTLPPGSLGDLRDTNTGQDDASSHRSMGSGC